MSQLHHLSLKFLNELLSVTALLLSLHIFNSLLFFLLGFMLHLGSNLGFFFLFYFQLPEKTEMNEEHWTNILIQFPEFEHGDLSSSKAELSHRLWVLIGSFAPSFCFSSSLLFPLQIQPSYQVFTSVSLKGFSCS